MPWIQHCYLVQNVNKIIFRTLIESLDDKWPDARNKALAIIQNTFSPDDKVFEQETIEQLVNKIQKITETDLNYGVRRNAELCLIAIRSRHVAKLRTILTTKKEMIKYVTEKVDVLTRPAFGSSLKLKHGISHC